MAVGNVVSKLVDVTYLWDLQPTYKGAMIHLLSTMDIPVRMRTQTAQTPKT